jgi:Peptidase M15
MDDYAFLASLSDHPDRQGDTANFNPAFATRLASAIRQARDAGLPVRVMSGYRSDTTTGSAYDAGGNSSHGYGLASDIAGLDGPNGKITQAWARIAEANGLHNPYGVGNQAEFNHWQLPEQPLERTPELLARLKEARSTGDWKQVWNAFSPTGNTAATQVASSSTSAPVSAPVPAAPSLGSVLGSAVASMGSTPAPPPVADSPPIRAMAAQTDFTPQTPNPVPANLGMGSQLGALAANPLAPAAQNSSITPGAPSMTSMLGMIGVPVQRLS